MNPIRHFLSHQHTDRPQVILLERDLRRRGLASWRDRKDQHRGVATDPAIRAAIAQGTDGFVIYGSPNILPSTYIWATEWPEAYLRNHGEADAGHAMPYPIIPLVVRGATIGDLHHAIEERRMKATDIHGELADVVSGRVPGRRNDHEIAVFDSTGTALEDVAAAAWAYERAETAREISFSG